MRWANEWIVLLPDSPHAPPWDQPRGWPWPMVVEPTWDAVHTDATWHTTYWIAEWPRVDVTPDFLGPLLFSPLRRSISHDHGAGQPEPGGTSGGPGPHR